jgi:predicted solute-binding protein
MLRDLVFLNWIAILFLNSLLAKNYHDIDIENCHPRIVEQLAKKLNLPHKAISDYIDRHEYWFESIKGAHCYD